MIIFLKNIRKNFLILKNIKLFVDTENMNINAGLRPDVVNATEKVGSMQENFAGSFYTDHSYTTTKDKIYVGDEIFAQVTWSKKNRDERLKFFVRNCALVQNQDRNLPVVR